MSQRGVEALLGRMLTDAEFRGRFFAEPAAAVAREGLNVTEREIDALLAIDEGRLAQFARELDGRIVRAAVTSLSGRLDAERRERDDEITGKQFSEGRRSR